MDILHETAQAGDKAKADARATYRRIVMMEDASDPAEADVEALTAALDTLTLTVADAREDRRMLAQVREAEPRLEAARERAQSLGSRDEVVREIDRYDEELAKLFDEKLEVKRKNIALLREIDDAAEGAKQAANLAENRRRMIPRLFG